MDEARSTTPASPSGDLLVFGSINQDIALSVAAFPAPGQTLKASGSARATGGKGANQAAAAALAGAEVHMIGAVGDDSAGNAARQALKTVGVDTSLIRTEAGAPTGAAYICVRSDGENTIVVDPGANTADSVADVADEVFAEAAWCLLSLEIPEEQAMTFAHRARANGVKVALNASPVLNRPLEQGLVDVLIVNELEAAAVAGDEWPSSGDIAERLGVDAVVVTQGGAGAQVLQRGAQAFHIPAERVTVRDTTGCGDAFAGVMVAALTRGAPYAEAVTEATKFAGHAAEHQGAMASYVEVVRRRST